MFGAVRDGPGIRPVITWGLSALAAERSIAVRYPLAPCPISGAVITLVPGAAQSGHADLAGAVPIGKAASNDPQLWHRNWYTAIDHASSRNVWPAGFPRREHPP
jgi:hypothetical protein